MRNSRPNVSEMFGTDRSVHSERVLGSLSESEEESGTESVQEPESEVFLSDEQEHSDDDEAQRSENGDFAPSQSLAFDDNSVELEISPMRDDTDVVQQALASARIDTNYGENGARFADLYYTSFPENLNTANLEPALAQEYKEIPTCDDPVELSLSNVTPRLRDIGNLQSRPKGPSSFPQRVQEKMQAAGDSGRLSHQSPEHDGPPVTAPPPQQDSYFRAREEIPDVIESIPLPPVLSPRSEDTSRSNTMSEESSSGESKFSFKSRFSTATSVDIPATISGLPNTSSSRLLPAPPIVTDKLPVRRLMTGRERAQTITTRLSPPITLHPGRARALSLSGRGSGTNAIRPSLAGGPSGGSTSSVKDRIRQLEERVKAAAAV